MGVFAGPEITESGLVLSLDAANNKSILSAVEVLVVAGGGGGGMDMGGGGGGGGVLYSSAVSITPGSAITATVGNGGVGAPAAGTNGQPGGHQYTISATQGGNSVFGSLTAIGGGFGGSSYYGYLPNYGLGGTGGSGGGVSGYSDGGTRAGGLGTVGQGNNGGQGGGQYYSGGGGGAGAPGANSTNQPNGGVGLQFSILGVSYFWGGGGGGNGYSGNGGYGGIGGGGGGSATNGNIGLAGTGGINIGSNGSSGNNAPGGNAGANTGGGGGGGSHYNANNYGGDGGSGIVIVRYPGSQRATGGTVTSVGGHTIHTFTTSGTFTPNFGDLSGDGNSGTLVNGVGYSASNGGALSFDGSNAYVLLTRNDFNTSLPNFTISVFVYKISDGIILGNHRHNQTWESVWLSTTEFTVNDANGTANRQSLYHTTPINSWMNLVAVNNSSQNYMKVFLNGAEIATKTATVIPWNSSIIPTIGANLFVGNLSPVGPINGKISNTTIYNRALSAAEISQNFNATRSRYSI